MDGAEGRILRVGLLCEGKAFQHWQAEALRSVLAVDGVQLVLVVVHKPPTDIGARSRNWRSLLYRQYRRRMFRSEAMRTEDLSDQLEGTPCIDVTPERRGHGQYFRPEDLQEIRERRPDVLLRFGFNILRGELLDLPRHGVWSFHHGDPEKFRGGPPGFWEIVKGDPVTGAMLQRLTDRLDGGLVLRRGWFRTIDHSLRETVDTVLMRTAQWPAEVITALLAGHPDAAIGEPIKGLGKVYRYPDNFQFLRFLWVQAMNKLAFHRTELKHHEDWNIGMLYQPIQDLVDRDLSQNVRWLPDPSTVNYRADPFGFTDAEGHIHLLYERFDHASGKGDIAKLRPKSDNVLKRSRTLLRTEHHYSYPYVVQREGTVFVVPESAAEGQVVLYRMNAANDGLEPVCTLLNESLFDPTLFEHEGRWWLLGTKAPLSNVALYAYHSEHFEGPYVPHLLNPVKLDIRSARPGGTPFVKQGILYRPAQDSSRTYGGRIALNRVLELSPTTFREEIVKFLGPMGGTVYNKGMHTLSGVGDITFIDGKRLITVPERGREVKQRKLERLKRRSK